MRVHQLAKSFPSKNGRKITGLCRPAHGKKDAAVELLFKGVPLSVSVLLDPAGTRERLDQLSQGPRTRALHVFVNQRVHTSSNVRVGIVPLAQRKKGQFLKLGSLSRTYLYLSIIWNRFLKRIINL